MNSPTNLDTGPPSHPRRPAARFLQLAVTNRGDRTRPGGPATYIVDGEWPTGSIDPGAPVATSWAATIAERLASAINDDARSTSAIAAAAEVARSTLYGIMNGTRWPDLVTVGELERHLDTELLPRSRR